MVRGRNAWREDRTANTEADQRSSQEGRGIQEPRFESGFAFRHSRSGFDDGWFGLRRATAGLAEAFVSGGRDEGRYAHECNAGSYGCGMVQISFAFGSPSRC